MEQKPVVEQTNTSEQAPMDPEQQRKLAALGKALQSQASQGAQQQTPKKAEPESIEETKEGPAATEEAKDGEATEAPKKKRKKNKKRKKKASGAADTGELMSTTAAAFVFTGAAALPAQFQDAQMPLPASGSQAAAPPTSATATATASSAAANPFQSMNLTAKTFTPVNVSTTGNPATQQTPQGDSVGADSSLGMARVHADSVDPIADFGGYQNPYSATIDIEKEKRKQQEQEEEAESKKTYSIDFMMSLRDRCRSRPNNMALLVLPHKKRQVKLNQTPILGQEKDAQNKFTNQVGSLRMLLNKISKENFDKVQQQLMNDFDYNPSLLQELMKIIFMKSTTETAYLDLYIKLCVGFFKKFDDPDHTEMNFKKLLLNRCQKQFYKMLQREQNNRRERRASMEEALIKDSLAEDFSNGMRRVFGDDELKMRQQDQMHGNMKLIVELFKLDMVSGNIVKTSLDELFQELTDRNVEVLCNMLEVLTSHAVVQSRKTRQEKVDNPNGKAEPAAPAQPAQQPAARNQKHGAKAETKKQYRAKHSVVTLDYLESLLQSMFKERTNNGIESRIRFKIQDLIDKFERDWKHEIFFLRKNETDSEGFQKKYVPKGSKMAQDAQASTKGAAGGKRSRKNSKVYVEKKGQSAAGEASTKSTKGQAAAEATGKGKSMYQLLSSLAPDADEEGKQEESQSEDEEAIRLVDRRQSINIDNVVGLDFEHYNKMKPSQQIKLKIKNLVMEFISVGDSEAASVDFKEICQQTDTTSYMVAGYILNNAFSQDQANWNRLNSLIVDDFFLKDKLFNKKDLVESLNVTMANFVDTIIDYPNSSLYVEQLFKRMQEVNVLTETQVAPYRQHIANVAEQSSQIDDQD